MEFINPISADGCRPYIGRPVCAVLYDGTQVVGTVRDATNDGLFFDNPYAGATVLSLQPAKAKKQMIEQMNKAKTSAFGYGYPYGYGYGYGSLAWASIALLFLIPFLFI
ncbi:hypothetical protein PASE110613_05060 [Paenibacillus sediminis]|uniref:Uncharacterized protein n=1 Tax=Paenibacillus sediminis TaxID=664909 RepID=A0ABS4H0T7_9BACL|nr:hypothetical protein [Paenibacillus sediminis]MBP1936143.1 hypothetical protein [Paenibacillus sediminis]